MTARGIKTTWCIAAITTLLLLLTAPVYALTAPSIRVLDFSGSAASDGVPPPWRLIVRQGKADVGITTEGDMKFLRLACKSSSFAVERKLSLSLNDTPYMTWTWKALKLPRSGDIRRKDANDQALQILLAFENGRVLSYVWDSGAPSGTVADESMGWPFNLRVKVIVVRSGSAGEGLRLVEKRNVADDYRRLFNEEPGRMKGVRVQSNTQYTGDTAEGMLGTIVFSRTSAEADLPNSLE